MAEPLYRQIAEDLRKRIEQGTLEPGSQLPAELELCDSYSASRNTTRDAIKWLTSRGLVETRPGQGTFVTRTIDPFVTILSPNPETGVGGGGEEIPWSLQTSFHPLDFITNDAALMLATEEIGGRTLHSGKRALSGSVPDVPVFGDVRTEPDRTDSPPCAGAMALPADRSVHHLRRGRSGPLICPNRSLIKASASA